MILRSIIVVTALANLAPLATAAASFESDVCRQSLERLHRIEETRRAERMGSATADGAGALVEQARRDAAGHCLGNTADPPRRPQARVSPPQSVEAIPVPPVVDLPARPQLPLPPAAVPGSRPPVAVTRCDSAGCWTSEGRYLLRVGPELVGPSAMCSLQAGVLSCR